MLKWKYKKKIFTDESKNRKCTKLQIGILFVLPSGTRATAKKSKHHKNLIWPKIIPILSVEPPKSYTCSKAFQLPWLYDLHLVMFSADYVAKKDH